MLQLLYKYFIINKKAVLPGIGVFHFHRSPASFDFSNKTFNPPAAAISFTGSEANADKQFYTYLSKEQQISEAEAAESLAQYAGMLKEKLEAVGQLELSGFGLLSKDDAGLLKFQPAGQLPTFLKPVSVERNISVVSEPQASAVETLPEDNAPEPAESEVSLPSSGKKSYWWIYAVILAAAAIAAIVYYYNQNGTLLR